MESSSHADVLLMAFCAHVSLEQKLPMSSGSQSAQHLRAKLGSKFSKGTKLKAADFLIKMDGSNIVNNRPTENVT